MATKKDDTIKMFFYLNIKNKVFYHHHLHSNDFRGFWTVGAAGDADGFEVVFEAAMQVMSAK